MIYVVVPVLFFQIFFYTPVGVVHAVRPFPHSTKDLHPVEFFKGFGCIKFLDVLQIVFYVILKCCLIIVRINTQSRIRVV